MPGKYDIIYSEAMKLNVVYKKLREITPYDKNAKKHDKTQIANVRKASSNTVLCSRL